MSPKKAYLWGTALSVALLSNAAVFADNNVIQYGQYFSGSEGAPAPVKKAYKNYNPAAPTLLEARHRAGFCALEAAMGIAQAYSYEHGCDTSAAIPNTENSNTDGFVANDNSGKATLTFASGLVIYAQLQESNSATANYGDKCQVHTNQGQKFGGVPVSIPNNSGDYGVYGWNRNNLILIGEVPRINVGPDWYDHHIIKDFLDGEWNGNPLEKSLPVTYDWGLNVVTKHATYEQFHDIGFPVSKWWQRSIHWLSNGIPGKTVIQTRQLVPGGTGCVITLDLEGYDQADDIVQGGSLTLKSTSTANTVEKIQ